MVTCAVSVPVLGAFCEERGAVWAGEVGRVLPGSVSGGRSLSSESFMLFQEMDASRLAHGMFCLFIFACLFLLVLLY